MNAGPGKTSRAIPISTTVAPTTDTITRLTTLTLSSFPAAEEAFDRRAMSSSPSGVRERALTKSSLAIWSDPCFDQQEQRANDQEKEPAWTLICAGQLYRRRSMLDRPLESLDISLIAVAIPVRTDLICIRTVPANLLQTPRRAQSCRLFAGSSRAQPIAEYFRDGIPLPLQIQFERASANLLRELLHLLESSKRRHLCRAKNGPPGCASRTSNLFFRRRNIKQTGTDSTSQWLRLFWHNSSYCSRPCRDRRDLFVAAPELKCMIENCVTEFIDSVLNARQSILTLR